MQKTNKAMMKRFKVTARGTLIHRSPGTGHLLRHKTARQKHAASKDKVLAVGMSARVMKFIAVGL
jgi:ribosomal protein L35